MPPDPGVIFLLFVVGAIVLAGIAYLVLLIARWNSTRIRYASPPRVRSVRWEPTARRLHPPFDPEPNETNNETLQPDAETEAEKISFAETAVADALARLIIAEELDLTKAVKIGAGKKSGEGYQKWSRLVKAAIERQKEQRTMRVKDERGERVIPI